MDNKSRDKCSILHISLTLLFVRLKTRCSPTQALIQFMLPYYSQYIYIYFFYRYSYRFGIVSIINYTRLNSFLGWFKIFTVLENLSCMTLCFGLQKPLGYALGAMTWCLNSEPTNHKKGKPGAFQQKKLPLESFSTSGANS